MRPVLLRMEGFASFRAPATVDFRDADYFVLVGPTGSGKSTVIDAMTFALYGSVPRWDDRRTVGLALAPTTGRATVSLVFDADGERYVAARELRRAASGSVTVRGARLERLADRGGTAEPGDETVPLAEGAQVSRRVEELLGLGFDDFCTCVVLPQGDFADFLHAPANKRQEKLEQILGLGVYDRVMRRANQEAAAKQQQADLLGEQLGRYADATAQAQDAAAARVRALEGLGGTLDAVLPEIEAATAELAAQQAVLARLRDERERLAALAVPAGVSELDRGQRAAAGTAEAATQREHVAELADAAARDRLAAAPDRAVLERLRAAHAELAAVVEGLRGLAETRSVAALGYAAARDGAATARAALEDARKARDAARDARAAAATRVDRLAAERDLLASPAVPAGLEDLDRRWTGAVGELERAAGTLAAAEAAETRARAAALAAPDRGPLEDVRRRHAQRAELDEQRAAAEAARAAAARVAAGARARLDEAGVRHDEARAQLDTVARSDLAAALRPGLAVGEHCPVCEQAVTTLPPALPVADLHAARHELAAADQAHAAARAADAQAAAALAVATAEVERLDGELARLAADLDGAPGPDEVAAALAERDRLDRAVADADAAVRAVRRARDTAAAAAEAVRAQTAAAAEGLRAARDPLVPLGAPAARADDVAAGWRALTEWARTGVAARDAALAEARATLHTATTELAAAEEAFAAAEREEGARRCAETAAARAEQEAAGHLAAAQRRVEELRAELGGAMPADAVDAELARLTTLEQDARAAAGALREARAARHEAAQAAAEVDRRVAVAWEALRGARDPLVALGAPVLDGTQLGPAWERLTGWAAREAACRDGALAAACATAERVREQRERLATRVAADLAAHDLTLDAPADPGRIAQVAARAVAAAVETARAARARIAERRAEADALAADRAAAHDEHQVARLLGQQLRSDRFPRWLVASALDALVADASTILADLSGGQFALTHDRGEFQVVDHADADARRPVKTLSGGETFQASLSLALALSAQMSGLAARGAARLESIFLDEGFGTLDESNLDVVASTLENLAAAGDRMVGVVTHVPALAERVPVRFVLSRDARTSRITREVR